LVDLRPRRKKWTNWARGSEGALAELPRATWTRPNSVTIIFHFFLTCGSRKSAKTKGPLRQFRLSDPTVASLYFCQLAAAASREK